VLTKFKSCPHACMQGGNDAFSVKMMPM